MLSKLNPFIRYAGSPTISNSSKYMRVGIDNRIFYCTDGRAVLKFDNETFEISKGMLIFIPRKIKYAIYSVHKENVVLTVLNFDLTSENSHMCDVLTPVKANEYTNKNEFMQTDFKEFSSYIIMRDAEKTGEKLKKIVRLFFYKEKYYKEFSSGILKTALLEIISQSDNENVSVLSKTVIKYLKEHYNENITGDKLSDIFKYHPYHISREIKKATGMSIKTYVMDLKIKASENFLLSTDKSITQIASECGFTDAAYFTKIFKRIKGITPKEYRAKIKNEVI